MQRSLLNWRMLQILVSVTEKKLCSMVIFANYLKKVACVFEYSLTSVKFCNIITCLDV